jgi:hypothetical protein
MQHLHCNALAIPRIDIHATASASSLWHHTPQSVVGTGGVGVVVGAFFSFF